MKKLFGFLTILVFIILNVRVIKAQEATWDSAQTADTSKSSYTLAYPGLLPDHPLYFLKAGKERMMAFFISHPLKKAEFNLLQADKRIHASLMLSQKGEEKLDLAQSTFSKGENYFEDALTYTIEAERQGINITEFTKKLMDANSKHRQVFDDMTKKLEEKNKRKFANEAKRLAEFEKRAEELAGSK